MGTRLSSRHLPMWILAILATACASELATKPTVADQVAERPGPIAALRVTEEGALATSAGGARFDVVGVGSPCDRNMENAGIVVGCGTTTIYLNDDGNWMTDGTTWYTDPSSIEWPYSEVIGYAEIKRGTAAAFGEHQNISCKLNAILCDDFVEHIATCGEAKSVGETNDVFGFNTHKVLYAGQLLATNTANTGHCDATPYEEQEVETGGGQTDEEIAPPIDEVSLHCFATQRRYYSGGEWSEWVTISVSCQYYDQIPLATTTFSSTAAQQSLTPSDVHSAYRISLIDTRALGRAGTALLVRRAASRSAAMRDVIAIDATHTSPAQLNALLTAASRRRLAQRDATADEGFYLTAPVSPTEISKRTSKRLNAIIMRLTTASAKSVEGFGDVRTLTLRLDSGGF